MGLDLNPVRSRCVDTPRNPIYSRQTTKSEIVRCAFLLLVYPVCLPFREAMNQYQNLSSCNLARLVSFNPFRARSFLLPATVPFHIWPLCCSPVPPAAGVFLPGRRLQHVGPGEWSRVENSLILQRSDDSSSLVLRGNVTRQRGSVSTHNGMLTFRTLSLLVCDLNVTVTPSALSCVTGFLIISFDGAVPSHVNYAPLTDYSLCTELLIAYYTILMFAIPKCLTRI